MLVRNYVKRLRMEAPLRSPPWPELPDNYTLVGWHRDLLHAHAEIKYRSFRHTLDAVIFPNLGVLDGCQRLMRTIVEHDEFVPEATWLVRGRALLRASLCGFRAAGLDYVQLEVCARNAAAVALYKSAGFAVRKTLYREARAEYTEYAI